MNRTQKNNLLKLLFNSGVNSVLPKNLIKNSVKLQSNKLLFTSINSFSFQTDISKYRDIYIIGAGKASASLAVEIEKILGDYLSSGFIVTKYGFSDKTEKVEIFEAGHPIPDNNSYLAAKRIFEIAENAKENDLVINLLSGGASSLLCLPSKNISINDIINTNKLLLECGASIEEINTIRRDLSDIKGGKLAKKIQPATTISLIISDVIGDNIEFIGSGPTVTQFTSNLKSMKIIEKYDLMSKIPENVYGILKNKKELKSWDSDKIFNFIIGNNNLAINAIRNTSLDNKIFPIVINEKIIGDVKIAAENYFEKIMGIKSTNSNYPISIISGGETTVKIKGNGKGGRNQEFCLILADLIKNEKNISILSGGTDGNDGSTLAAGAVVDEETIKIGNSIGINYKKYLNNNDSFNYFSKINELVITEPTKTNVADIQITLLT